MTARRDCSRYGARAGALAQDETSSAVFGMPREAVRIGAAERVLSLDAIAPEMRRLVREPEGSGP